MVYLQSTSMIGSNQKSFFKLQQNDFLQQEDIRTQDRIVPMDFDEKQQMDESRLNKFGSISSGENTAEHSKENLMSANHEFIDQEHFRVPGRYEKHNPFFG